MFLIFMKSSIFWDITPCSQLKVNRRFGETWRLHLQCQRIRRKRNQRENLFCLPPEFRLVSCSDYSSTLKMEAVCSSETSVDFQRTTRRYIPQDRTLHNHRCENLKSYTVIFIFTAARILNLTKTEAVPSTSHLHHVFIISILMLSYHHLLRFRRGH
jgi:hypothetical protein